MFFIAYKKQPSLRKHFHSKVNTRHISVLAFIKCPYLSLKCVCLSLSALYGLCFTLRLPSIFKSVHLGLVKHGLTRTLLLLLLRLSLLINSCLTDSVISSPSKGTILCNPHVFVMKTKNFL